MDTVFWIGLGLGALISVPLSITANLWTDKARYLLDKRRRIRLSNKKSKEVRTYFFVRALREGDPTAKILFDIDAASSIRTLIFSAMDLTVLACLALVVSDARAKPYMSLLLGSAALLTVMGLGFCFWSIMLEARLLTIRQRLRWFHDYETSIRVKWGDDAIEEMMAQANQASSKARSLP
jgi:hypothetical protein